MRRDAAEWALAAQRMGGAAAAAGQLALGDYELSLFGAQTGLAAAYQEIHRWASGLLTGAQTNLTDMDKTLRAAADTYQAQELSGARSFDQLQRGGN